MSKICVIMLIALFCLPVLCACEEVVVTSCDELVSKNWYTENVSGIGATLKFSGDRATFTVTEDKKQAAIISGTFAADSEKFYITSDDLACTFEFGYKVFSSRAEITYNSVTLVFYPVEKPLPKNVK